VDTLGIAVHCRALPCNAGNIPMQRLKYRRATLENRSWNDGSGESSGNFKAETETFRFKTCTTVFRSARMYA
jgi:hypothetical protein